MRRLTALALATMLVAGACGEAQALLGRLASGLPGYQSATAAPATPAPTEGVDQAALAAALQRLAASPGDPSILMEIADLYYAANDFESASTWLDELLAIEPANLPALLARGASAFNLGDFATAETSWKRVVALDAANLEAHYDLGFLYFNQDPPDLAGVRREWNTVINLDPTSTLATTVREHLTTLGLLGASPAP